MCPQPKVTVINPEQRFTDRVAIYCRVSTSSPEQMNSLANQVSSLTHLINRHLGWYLVDIYLDIQSGRNSASRPEFKRMMDDCAQKKLDRIITKSVSRFGRNTVDTLDAINKLRAFGIDVYFASENMHSLEGKNAFMISILESVAQEESVARSKNIKWGLMHGIQNGQSKIYGRKCYGYVQDNSGNLVINEPEAEVVKMIFDFYLSGFSINAIRSELKMLQIKSPTGQDTWSKRTVDTMLINEKYTGDVMVLKTYSEAYPNNKRIINRGEQAMYVAVGAHPAIIPKDVFIKVKDMRESRSNIVRDENGSTRKATRYSMKRAKEKPVTRSI